jgi:hypothetical protein
VAISQTCAPSKKSASRIGVADKPVSDACFYDCKRFCFVLREIASGENGRPLPGFEAQMRAQALLAECGYKWPGRAEVQKPIVAHGAARGEPNAKAPVATSNRPNLICLMGRWERAIQDSWCSGHYARHLQRTRTVLTNFISTRCIVMTASRTRGR